MKDNTVTIKKKTEEQTVIYKSPHIENKRSLHI